MAPARSRLATCHGFTVSAGDERIGTLETPCFSGAADEPEYLLIRTSDAILGRFRIVPATLVAAVDPQQQLIQLRASQATIAALPEHLPLHQRTSRRGPH